MKLIQTCVTLLFSLFITINLSGQCESCESKAVVVECSPCGQVTLKYSGGGTYVLNNPEYSIKNGVTNFFDTRGNAYPVGWDKVRPSPWEDVFDSYDFIENCNTCDDGEMIDLTPITDKLCDIYEQDSLAFEKTCEIAATSDSIKQKLCDLIDINTEGFEAVVTSITETNNILEEQLAKLCEIAESEVDSLLLDKMCQVFEQDSLNNEEFLVCLDSIKTSINQTNEALTDINENLTESLVNDSLELICLQDIKEALGAETFDVEVIPYCVDGVQISFEAIFDNVGVLQNEYPDGDVGFCASTDTIGIEKTVRYVCAVVLPSRFPKTIVATDCYENGVLVGTIFTSEGEVVEPIVRSDGECISDIDVELVFYCLDGVTVVGEVVYNQGLQISSTIPEGAVLGFCNPSDTIDYELYSSFICVDGQTIERIRCYENGQLVGTIYEPNIPVLEFEFGACSDPIYGVNNVCFVVDDVEVEYKEFCYKDLPSVYQDQDGEVVDVTGLERCIDICLDTETSSDLVCIEADGNSFYAFAVIDITSECETGKEIDRENYYVDLDGVTYTDAELSEDCEGEPIAGKVCSDGVTYNTITTDGLTTYYNLGGIEVEQVKVEYYGECIEPISVIKSCAVLDGSSISGLLYSGEGNNYFTDFEGNILLEAMPYCCDDCIYIVGCYDLRTTTMNSITLCDGTIIGVQDLVNDGRPNSVNDGIETITTFFGGYGKAPDGSAGSLICDGTNRHSIEIYNTSTCIASFQLSVLGNPETAVAQTYGQCNKDVKGPTVEVCYLEGENGIIGQRWDSELNAAAWGEDAFSSATTHVNGAPDEEVVITNNWSLNDLDFPSTGAYQPPTDRDISSQEIYKATLCVDKPTQIRDNNANTGELIDFYVGDCNKDFVKKASTFTTGSNRGLGEFYCLPIGCTDIVININDYSVYGGFNLQYYDNTTDAWANFPITKTYQYQPSKLSAMVYVEDDGSYTNLDGTPFAFDVVECEVPCYPLSREPVVPISVDVENACFDVDGDPENYINVTQETVFVGDEKTITYYTGYGGDDEQVIPIGSYVFIDCLTGEPIDEPVIPVNCEDAYRALAFAPVGDNGVNFEYWNDLNQTYTAQQQAADVFNGAVDYSGMPAINENEGLPEYRKEADLFIRDPDITQNAYRFWTYIYLTEPVRIREFHPTAESFSYFDGECQTTPTLSATGDYFNNTLPSDFDKSYPAGIHYLGGEVYDFSAWGYTRYQYSDDNGITWKNIPASWLYCSEPRLEECQVQVCTKESGAKVLTDIETCLPLGSEYTLKKPTLCSGEVAVASEPQCAPQTFYKIVLGEVGTVEQKWTDSAVNTSVNAGHSYKDAFNLIGADGLPAHPNTSDLTVSNTTASTTNVLDGDSPIRDDQAQSDFWIYLTEDANLQEFNATAESVGVWISDKCGTELNEVLDATYTNATANPLGLYSKGWYKVRLYHHDVTANGVARLQVDYGDGFANIPAYLTQPKVEVIKGWYCDDGKNYNQDKSEVLDESWLCEDPRCLTK